MKKIIIDTDPGKDDFFAITYLVLSGQADILALTTVCGNSSIQNVTNNARFTLDSVQANIPIYSGASEPFNRVSKFGQVMGTSGLDGVNIGTQEKLNGLAVNKIIELVRAYPQQVTILAIGPLTNIAQAFQKDPQLPSLINQLVIMGGAIQLPGNTSRTAEFNIGFDPEAAGIVFKSLVKKTLIPLDLCYANPLQLSDLDVLKVSPLYSTLVDLLIPYQEMLKANEGQEGIILYDLLAAYYLTNPQSFDISSYNLQIETQGEFTRGMTVADLRLPPRNKPNTYVATGLNRATFINDFITVLERNYEK